MRRLSASRRRFPTAEAEHDQQDRADADRRIGDVERRTRPLPVVHLDEIGHVAEAHAVDQIAERTADDQRRAAAPCATRRARMRRSHTASTALTAIASSVNSQRCQPSLIGQKTECGAGC